ncbi:MAG: DUF4331 domain-containing protein [Verrucomicrobia bacterium]|nr:DUF4331 domain-containing protein [Verrucomicrobiota bacterium]
MKNYSFTRTAALAVASLSLASVPLHASSHREAPMITHLPKLDSTDFYMFNSYEAGRSNFVTIVACYIPIQAPYGGPNFFEMDPDALYEIHVDNDGDAKEDLTFQFQFTNTRKDIALPIGPAGNQRMNAIPLVQAGQIFSTNNAALNVVESYTIKLIKGNRRTGTTQDITNAKDGSKTFIKPVDYIGAKTLPDYEAYVDLLTYSISIPGSATPGRVVVTQRKDPFVVNLGETFDLINFNPLGPVDGRRDVLDDDNVTAIILEIPKEALLKNANSPIIGAWTTASKISAAGTNQVSRLSMPLVNELVIGLKDKDKFSMSEPKDDVANFVDYVTHPTLPALIELLFGVKAPTAFPRNDLVAVFATGVSGLNQPANVSPGEMTRLNTAIAAVPREQQNNLGVIAGITKGVLDASKADLAGFPNGRRPGDDVVDIALRVVMGKLLTPDVAPIGDAPLTDGAYIDARMFRDKFPYLNSPIVTSPLDLNEISITLQSAAKPQGPYSSVPVEYDQAGRTISTSKPTGDAFFYKLKTNAKIGLDEISTTKEKVIIGINPL